MKRRITSRCPENQDFVYCSGEYKKPGPGNIIAGQITPSLLQAMTSTSPPVSSLPSLEPASPPAYGLQSLEPAHLVTTIATLVVLGLFFMSFLFILFCRFIFEHASRSSRSIYLDSSSNDNGDNASGLDPVIKEMFPTFRYSTVKSCAKDGLECAVCLSEMEDEDMLRLLTVCCHVFHQGCIDKWLGTRTTCPICRASLSNPEKRHNMCPVLQNNSLQVLGENEQHSDDHSIADLSRESDDRFGDDQVTLTIQSSEWAERGGDVFPKAHSTGHSIIFVREEKDDKYKLLLTAPVRAEIVKGHRCARSCTIFGDFSDKPSRSPGDSST